MTINQVVLKHATNTLLLPFILLFCTECNHIVNYDVHTISQKSWESIRRSYNITELSKILKLKNNQIDIAVASSLISDLVDDGESTTNSIIQFVDSITNEILSQLANEETNTSILNTINKTINNYITYNNNNKYWDSSSVFTQNIIQTKSSNCLGLSILYYSIGSRLGLPLNIVFIPRHAFIRYDDGNNVIDIETTLSFSFIEENLINNMYRSNMYISTSRKDIIACLILNRGHYYNQFGYIDKAEENYSIAYDLCSELVNTIYPDYILCKEKKYEELIGICTHELNEYGDDVVTRIRRAKTYYLNKQYNEAIMDINNVINKSGKHANVMVDRGFVNIKLNKYSEALDDFDDAIRLNKKHVGAYGGQSIVYLKKNENDKALQKLESAIKLSPDVSELYFFKAHIYYKQKKYENAIVEINRAIDIDGYKGKYYKLRIVLNIRSKNSNKINNDIINAIKNGIVSADLKIDIGKAYCGINNEKVAVEYFSDAINDNNKNIEGYLLRGNAYKSIGDYNKSVIDFTDAIKIDDSCFDAYLARSLCYLLMGNMEKAQQDQEKYIQLIKKYVKENRK